MVVFYEYVIKAPDFENAIRAGSSSGVAVEAVTIPGTVMARPTPGNVEEST